MAAREKHLQALEQAELEERALEADLIKIREENCSIEAMKKVLADGVRKLTLLQIQVDNLLTFFENTFNEVERLGDQEVKGVLEISQDEEGRVDEIIKELLLNDAFKVKSSFLFVARISQVYTEISSEYIRPGLAEIEEIGLSNDSVTDLDIGLKQGRLNDYKRRSRAGVKAMTEAKQKELQEGLEDLVRKSVISLTKV